MTTYTGYFLNGTRIIPKIEHLASPISPRTTAGYIPMSPTDQGRVTLRPDRLPVVNCISIYLLKKLRTSFSRMSLTRALLQFYPTAHLRCKVPPCLYHTRPSTTKKCHFTSDSEGPRIGGEPLFDSFFLELRSSCSLMCQRTRILRYRRFKVLTRLSFFKSRIFAAVRVSIA